MSKPGSSSSATSRTSSHTSVTSSGRKSEGSASTVTCDDTATTLSVQIELDKGDDDFDVPQFILDDYERCLKKHETNLGHLMKKQQRENATAEKFSLVIQQATKNEAEERKKAETLKQEVDDILEGVSGVTQQPPKSGEDKAQALRQAVEEIRRQIDNYRLSKACLEAKIEQLKSEVERNKAKFGQKQISEADVSKLTDQANKAKAEMTNFLRKLNQSLARINQLTGSSYKVDENPDNVDELRTVLDKLLNDVLSLASVHQRATANVAEMEWKVGEQRSHIQHAQALDDFLTEEARRLLLIGNRKQSDQVDPTDIQAVGEFVDQTFQEMIGKLKKQNLEIAELTVARDLKESALDAEISALRSKVEAAKETLTKTQPRCSEIKMTEHGTQQVICCLECSYESNHYNGLYDHMFDEHEQRLMGQLSSYCGNCNQRLTSLEAYAQHTHARVRRCAVCCSMVSGDDELHAHKVHHAQFGYFFCIFCGACFVSERRLNRHLIKHACDTWVMCRECGMRCKQVDQVIDHFFREHYSWAEASFYNCKPCGHGVNDNTVTQPCQHVVARHVVYAVGVRDTLDVDQQTFRVCLTASARFLYDKVNYKEAFACALCSYACVSTSLCRLHALTVHRPTRPPPSCPAWSFLTLAKAPEPMSDCSYRCAYCDEHHLTFMRLAQHLKAAHPPVHLCSSCDDAPYDDFYDAAYHAQFSHGAAPLAVDVAPPHDSPLVSSQHGLIRSPSFSPLYCLLCGACLADKSFVTHISSHRLTASVNCSAILDLCYAPKVNGSATLDLCPVCGVCLVNKSEENLRTHLTSHGACEVLDEALTALLGTDLRFFRCFCNGIACQTPTPSSTSCLDPDLYLTANCTEPPYCSVCDEILSWNGPGIVDHFIQFHAPSPDATSTLLCFHKEHSARVANGQLFCRMCNFLASWPCC